MRGPEDTASGSMPPAFETKVSLTKALQLRGSAEALAQRSQGFSSPIEFRSLGL